MGFGVSQLPADDLGFFEMGLDSLMAMDLRNRLQGTLGHALSSTLTFDYPNVPKLAEHLLRDVLQLEFAGPGESRGETTARDRLLEEVRGLTDDKLEELVAGELDALDGK